MRPSSDERLADMLIRSLLILMVLVLVGCGQSSDETQVPTRAPGEVIATTTGTTSTQTPSGTVVVPTLVPTRTVAPTAAATQTAPPTDVPATPTATTEPSTPTGIATVTPLPTATATATLSPTASATTTPEPTTTERATEQPSEDFETVRWEGLLIPVPDGYEDRDATKEDERLLRAPVIAKLLVQQRDSEDQPELPNPMIYTIVRYEDGAAAWLDEVRDGPNGDLAIDDDTVEPVTVAGLPGQTYESHVPGTGQPLFYVVELADDRLLLISLDRAYPEHERVVALIERDTSEEELTPTPSSDDDEGDVEGELAYLLDGDIWLYDFATEEFRQLTKIGNVREFAWSPDGLRIAFAAGEEDTVIETIDVRDGERTTITDGGEAAMFPAFSPNGTLFFLRRNVGDQNTTIDIVKYVDGEETVVHSEPGGLVGPTALRFRSEDEWALAVSTGRGRYVLLGDLRTNTSKDLAETYLSTAGCAYDIAWRDDEAVVLTSLDCIPFENSTIWRLDLEDENVDPTRVHTDSGVGSVDWSADGVIVFNRSETGAQSDGIWILADDEPRRILEEGTYPLWRP
jgi:hypothetical protein